MGSSPLTRGKRFRCADDRLDLGLIPAHAGKTQPGAHQSDRGRAHPRSRGENILSAMASLASLGSSPLTRGKHATYGEGCSQRGLIPAHAGKTWPPGESPGRCGAHPRSRGENAVMNHPAAAALGSSPLTRGKRGGGCAQDCVQGLIPAHAGKTRPYTSRRLRCRAHPRSRGENVTIGPLTVVDRGSSPLTRGKPGRRVGAH